MAGEIAVLADRRVIEVSGPDARALLQRLITNDVEALEPGQARYAALLTPQGKIITDFLVVRSGEDFLLDVPAATALELAKKLAMYRLRADVVIADRSDRLGVVAYAGGEPPPGTMQAYADPRSPALWPRAILPKEACTQTDEAARAGYEARRIEAGVPEGGVDFAFGDTFPHDANLDRLHGVDFRKGCYVGQEVVSRVEHRGTARKRIVAFGFEGQPPARGSDIVANGTAIGTFGSAVAGRGLGLVRIDKLAEATGRAEPVVAAGIPLRPADAE